MGRAVRMTLVIVLAATGCAGTTPEPSPPASIPATPTAEPTPEPTIAPTPSPSPAPSLAPRSLFGIWRATLAGQPLSLSIRETTYRIVRGTNTATGSVRVTGDQIEFFGSDLCNGSGFYRWAISDVGALSFFPTATEPCDGRLEALNVDYPDYSPRTAGSSAPPEEGGAPPELADVWQREFVGETMYLTLQGTRYSVGGPSGGSISGRIAVDGDRIVFSQGDSTCTGAGTYTWRIEDDELRMTLAGTDPCARVSLLTGVGWTRR